MTSTITEGRSIAAARLLGYSGYRGPFSLVPLAGGKNNQVFRVDLADQSLVLKAYYQHPGDLRDRLGAEYAFSTFAWSHGIRSLPQPLACDAEHRMALYEFIPGRKLTPAEVTPQRVAEAAAFYTQLNSLVRKPEAARLPAGSEACFRLGDHLDCLAKRSERLRQIEPASPVDHDAAAFVAHDLAPLCAAVLEATREKARAIGVSVEGELAAGERCLSPSDFGFHNALRVDQGGLKFLDFEYAGWDDPAKTVCDFFCQPELPAPLSCFDEFAAAVTAGLAHPERHRQRIDLLLPVYRLKWCCIMLNDFLPAGNQRRQFARAEEEETERKARQLAKARQAAALVAESLEARLAA
ncbi:MAG TPA: aminoglycoside phosphotransferase family protein [Planctomycetaceae bacterium]|nr:aminoglycoside phosphotransferase family protein [Planctomycetaceae bacterium]